MTDDIVRIEFEVSLDEAIDYQARGLQRLKLYRRWRLQWLLLSGAVGGAIGVMFIALLLRRPLGVEVLAGVVGGAFVGPLFGRLYDRDVSRRMRAIVKEQYGEVKPTRCEIELRPDCLWHLQDGVETTFDWPKIKAVHDKPYGVELWLDHGPILATNRAFATSSDRERFLNRARAALQAAPRATTDEPEKQTGQTV